MDKAQKEGTVEKQKIATDELHGAEAERDEILRQLREAGVGYLVLGSLIGFIAFFAFSSGAVIWVFISEIFPTAVRSKGQTLGSFTHWFMAMLISWIFPAVARDLGQPGAGLPFAFFAASMVAQLFVVGMFFPETKQVALEDMNKKLQAS